MNADITFYISIISSFLLTISELLPYIKSIKSNGILESFISMLEHFHYTKITNNNDTENIKDDHLQELINEIRSYKETFITYLNDKKINISIT